MSLLHVVPSQGPQLHERATRYTVLPNLSMTVMVHHSISLADHYNVTTGRQCLVHVSAKGFGTSIAVVFGTGVGRLCNWVQDRVWYWLGKKERQTDRQTVPLQNPEVDTPQGQGSRKAMGNGMQ